VGLTQHVDLWLDVDAKEAAARCSSALEAIGCESIKSKVDGNGHQVRGKLPAARKLLAGGECRIKLTPRDDLTHGQIEVISLAKQDELVAKLKDMLADISVDEPVGASATVGISDLPKQVRKHAAGHIGESEPILFFLEGNHHQTLVALPDRVAIFKPGFMANSTGGCRVTAIPYREMTGVQMNTGMMLGVFQVTSPSYPAVRTDFWTNADNMVNASSNSPTVAPNCIPIAKRDVKLWEPELDRLRRLIAEAHAPIANQVETGATPPAAKAAERLKQLAELREMGILTDEEYGAKKAEMLKEL
jgi:Short C-terminal domain